MEAGDGRLTQQYQSMENLRFFDAGDGWRWYTNAPIITKPQVAILKPGKDLVPGQPNVYFGTGGDDRAPDDVRYRFYSVRDDEPAAACASESDLTKAKNETDLRFGDGDGNGATFEWVIGDGLKNTAWPPEAVSNAGEEGAAGDRYWSIR